MNYAIILYTCIQSNKETVTVAMALFDLAFNVTAQLVSTNIINTDGIIASISYKPSRFTNGQTNRESCENTLANSQTNITTTRRRRQRRRKYKQVIIALHSGMMEKRAKCTREATTHTHTHTQNLSQVKPSQAKQRTEYHSKAKAKSKKVCARNLNVNISASRQKKLYDGNSKSKANKV